jgi:multidrug efflux system outer membrane protein
LRVGKILALHPRFHSLLQQDLTVTIPPGLTSALLERRPDIRFAEQTLVAAQGSARFGQFPQ